jgi:hypothetical protein
VILVRRLRRDDGLTMVETLIGIVLMTSVIAFASNTTIHAMNVQRQQVGDIEAVARGRVAMQRITRGLRGANPLIAAPPGGTEVTVQLNDGAPGFDRTIRTYRLVGDRIESSGFLLNSATEDTSPLPTVTLIRGVQPAPGEPVFAYELIDGTAPGPDSDLWSYHEVTVNLRLVRRHSSSTALLTATVALRNTGVDR